MMVPYDFATSWQSSPSRWARVWGWTHWVVDSLRSAVLVQPGPGERVLLAMVAENRREWSHWARCRGNERVPSVLGTEAWVRSMNAQLPDEGEVCSGYNGCTSVQFPDGSTRCADCGHRFDEQVGS